MSEETCKSNEHSFVAVDVTKRTPEKIEPKYKLFCQKCGATKNL
jgi:hypothetical protein